MFDSLYCVNNLQISDIYFKQDRGAKPHYTNNKSDTKSIYGDLSKSNISEDVKLLADDIYRRLNLNTKRGRQRKKLMFYCVIKAYRELGIVCDPKIVAKEVGINMNEINKAINMGNEYSRISGSDNGVYHKPQDFIPDYCKQLMLPDECKEEILKLTSEIINKQPSILENYPQVLAAAIILYYLTTHGVKIDIDEFSKIFLRSPVTIQKLVKVIADIDQT